MTRLNILLVTTIFTCIIASCSTSEKKISNSTDIILYEESNNSNFIDAIQDVNVLPLQIGDDYIYLGQSKFYIGGKYIYSLDGNFMQLMCFDKATGEKQFSMPIRGRGPNECIEVTCMSGNNDTLYLCDIPNGHIKTYNHQGKYLGNLNDNKIHLRTLYPTSDGKYLSFDMLGSMLEGNTCINIFDKNFNIISTEYSVPKEYSNVVRFSVGGATEMWYMSNDTLYFMYPFSHKLISYPGYHFYNFISSKPLSDEQKDEFKDNLGAYVSASMTEGYESEFSELLGYKDIITFKYSVNNVDYRVIVRKNTLEILSILEPRSSFPDDNVTTEDLWRCIMHESKIVGTDGKTVYAVTPIVIWTILNKYKNILDTKLTKIHHEMQQIYTADIGDVFNEEYCFVISIDFAE